MEIVQATVQDAERWNQFVESHDLGVNYVRWQWKQAIERAFGWRTYYLIAEEAGRVRGVLPLVWQNSRVFGNLLSSMPYFSEGGVLADAPDSEKSLLDEAISLSKQLKAKRILLRQTEKLAINWEPKTDRVILVFDLDPDPEVMMQRFDTKMRSNVRRSCKKGLEAEFGGIEFLDEFYDVFARRMRDLGTPVYGKGFFEEILKAFPSEAFICRVRHQGKVVSASFMTGYKTSIESNWAAALPEGKELKASMFMAWQSMCFAGKKGYTLFDFGRSEIGSATYKFKLEWNTRIVPLYWYNWSAEGGASSELDRRNPKFQRAISIWKKLPLGVTKIFGPPIAKCAP